MSGTKQRRGSSTKRSASQKEGESIKRDRLMVLTLTRWFQRNARPLPWRHNRTAYTALVSEAMLQQTQIARVVERYPEFMQRFPTIESLAAADEQAVLAMWQGLGYYRRARNLHAAARMIVAEHDGQIPSDVKQLQQLPGVGRYTAGAIASIVFNKHEPIVDGNAQRVLARWYARRGVRQSGDLPSWSWRTAEKLVRLAPDPSAFNEGLMELGSTICTPRTPQCHSCPLAQHCLARHHGAQNRIPAAGAAVARRTVHHHAVVITRRAWAEMLLEQRSDGGMWAGMWQVPTVECDHPLTLKALHDVLLIPVTNLRKAGEFMHNTTHRAITFHVYAASTRVRKGCWFEVDALHKLPISSAQRKVIDMARAALQIAC